MADLSKLYLYRMTHIENIPHILRYGITHSSSQNSNPGFVPIGDVSLISTRSNFTLNNGRILGDYIPFYFTYRTPMLYVIQNGFNMVAPTPAQDIIYIVCSVSKILELGHQFVFTDGHAVDSFSSQYSNADIHDIDNILDKKALAAKYWKTETDLDLKRRKEAEFLVLGDIAPTGILGYCVFNAEALSRMLTFGIEESKIIIRPDYYF